MHSADDAVGAKHLEPRSSSRKGVRGGAAGQTGQLGHKVVGSIHSKRQIHHTRRANGQMLAAVFDRTIHRVRNELGRRRMRMKAAPAPAPAPAKTFAGSVAVRGFQVVSSVVGRLTVGMPYLFVHIVTDLAHGVLFTHLKNTIPHASI